MDFIKHVVKKGDNLTKIAKKYGFSGGDWKKLYNHPKNAGLKKKRPNPDHIEPKDEILIPSVPGKKIDDEVSSLKEMQAKLMSMPIVIRRSIMEGRRMHKETARIMKSGAIIRDDIVTMKGMNTTYKVYIGQIDQQLKAADHTGKADATEKYVKNFRLFQRRQEMLAKMISGMKGIEDAERHLARDPKKAMFTVQGIGADVMKQEKLMKEWTKAHADVLKEVNARLKVLLGERKETI